MSFLNFSHVTITDAFLLHVVAGEPDDLSRGGHLFGTRREGKTEFPKDWTTETILFSMSELLDKPEHVHFSGQNIFLRKHVLGILVEMKLRAKVDVLIPQHYFPVEGPGVTRNVSGSQVSLDISSQEVRE
jgi:hypothetical protein